MKPRSNSLRAVSYTVDLFNLYNLSWNTKLESDAVIGDLYANSITRFNYLTKRQIYGNLMKYSIQTQNIDFKSDSNKQEPMVLIGAPAGTP